jgi:hypothetical protein
VRRQKEEREMETYYVEIVKIGKTYEKAEVIKSMGPFNERKATRVDRGANINLNHQEYFTRIVEGNYGREG